MYLGEDLGFRGKQPRNITGRRNNFSVEIQAGQSRWEDRWGAAVNPIITRFGKTEWRVKRRRSGMWRSAACARDGGGAGGVHEREVKDGGIGSSRAMQAWRRSGGLRGYTASARKKKCGRPSGC
jgi:hypothetical protein